MRIKKTARKWRGRRQSGCRFVHARMWSDYLYHYFDGFMTSPLPLSLLLPLLKDCIGTKGSRWQAWIVVKESCASEIVMKFRSPTMPLPPKDGLIRNRVSKHKMEIKLGVVMLLSLRASKLACFLNQWHTKQSWSIQMVRGLSSVCHLLEISSPFTRNPGWIDTRADKRHVQRLRPTSWSVEIIWQEWFKP